VGGTDTAVVIESVGGDRKPRDSVGAAARTDRRIQVVGVKIPNDCTPRRGRDERAENGAKKFDEVTGAALGTHKFSSLEN
jgi:hypothetical protein